MPVMYERYVLEITDNRRIRTLEEAKHFAKDISLAIAMDFDVDAKVKLVEYRITEEDSDGANG